MPYLLPKEKAGALPRLESGTIFPENKKLHRCQLISIAHAQGVLFLEVKTKL